MAPKEQPSSKPGGEIILYQSEDQKTRIQVRLVNETVWLSLNEMTELFQRDKSVISRHIQNVFDEGELARERVVANFATTAADGKTYKVDFYNLNMIISVAYRVKSQRGTQFRIWATARLKEYLVKGFVMDDERLKNPPEPGVPDYFDEILERIRDIRSSEKRLYLRVRDIFKLAADYDPTAAETLQFFQIIQNKLHWAVTGKTAAELIAGRADHTQPNMGLTSWKDPKVRRTDITIAKNYLRENEIGELNRIVSMYLDFAEDQAQRRKVLYMRDWREKLDAFLRFNERDILADAGRVTKAVADQLALDEYDKFHARRLQAESTEDAHTFEEAVKKLPPTKLRKKQS